jgi:hypothetical protein
MNQRDQISISSQSILWVGGVGVALLTMVFVLGVQVGKQSAALHRPTHRDTSENLKDLPEPLVDQLKFFETDNPEKLVPATKVEVAAPKVEAVPPKAEAAGVKTEEKPAEAPAKPPAKPLSETWTLQLIATEEVAEAKRTADKAKAAGFATVTVKEKGQLKVRLSQAADRATLDKTAEKLKKAGFKAFPMKVE